MTRRPRHLRPAALLLGLAAALSLSQAAAGKPAVRLRNPYKPGQRAPDAGALMKVQGGHHLDASQYEQIRDASIALMTKFPPSKYYYVGVGRAPAPIMAFLENLSRGAEVALNFPSSDLRSHDPLQHKEAYFSYFAKLLPKSVIEGDRTILLIDRAGIYGGNSAGGTSVVKLKKVLEAYLKQKGSKADVDGVAYAPHPLRYKELHRIDTAKFREVEVFGSQIHDRGPSYDLVARHPQNNISQRGVGQLRENTRYDTYKDKMLERMRADKTLGTFLAKLGADAE